MRSYIHKWHTRYLAMCNHVGTWSKDPGTKVGAVIVNSDNKIVSTGYNGFPAGMDDRRMVDRDFKLRHVVHAEMNAIFNARCDIRGSTLYISHPPCPQCAKLVNAAGIKRVLWIQDDEFADRWNSAESEEVFSECGVVFSKVKPEDIN